MRKRVLIGLSGFVVLAIAACIGLHVASGTAVQSEFATGGVAVAADLGSRLSNNDAIFRYVEVYEPIPPSPDFNGDGIVDIEDLIILIEHWGLDEPSFDIAPPPFGDGIVDVQDLEVLMSYWQQEVLPVSLLAYWKLDETEGDIAYDSVGDNDGTINGNPIWQPSGGKVGGALEFDGIDDYVETGFILDPAKRSLSVFAWVKGGAPGQVIISQISGVDWLLADAEGQLMTELKRGFIAPNLTSGSVIIDGDWHHIGVVWDESNRLLYVDGTEVAGDTTIGYLMASNGGLYIGAGKDLDATSFFSGLIDDVRIYKVALTETIERPWGQPVMGLRMRVSGQSDLTWPAERTVVVLELENVSDTSILFRQLGVNTIPEALAESGQHLRVKGWIGESAWTTWTGALEPGEVMAWTEHLSRMRFVDPPKQGTEMQVRFLLRFRSKPPEPRVTHPLFTVFSNALTVKVIEPLPYDARTPADIPAKWNRSMYLVWVQGSGIRGKRTLHIDGSGRAQLVRPPYGYKDTLVPWGSYEAALSPTRLTRVIQVLREESTWRQLELVESGPGIDREEIHIALTWHGGTLLRSFPEKATREHEALHLLRHEMEVLMAEVVAQHKSRQRGSDEE